MVETRVCSPEILDVGRVLDQEENVWELGYQTFYRRRKIVKFIDKVLLEFSSQQIISESFFCDPYINMCFMMSDLQIGGNSYPLLRPEVSPDNVTFFRLCYDGTTDPTWNGSAARNINWAKQSGIYCPYVRVKIDQANPSAGRTDLVSVWGAFSS